MCECCFCGRHETLENAIDAGWEPSFFVGEEQQRDEVCPECSAVHLQVGDDGVLVVDTKLGTASAALLETIRKISTKPIRYIVNTHWHPDHIASNEGIAKAGSTIAGGNVSGTIADASTGAAVLAHENVLIRMSGQDNPPPFEAWPTDTMFVPQKDLYFNGEAVQLLHQPPAHTDAELLLVMIAGQDDMPPQGLGPQENADVLAWMRVTFGDYDGHGH